MGLQALLSWDPVTKLAEGAVVGAVSGATVGAFFKGYFGDRGKRLATKHDIKQIQEELAKNTEITKTIEINISGVEFLRKNELAFRQKQLSDLYGPLYSYIMSQKQIVPLWQDGKMTEKNLEIKQMLAEQNKIMRNIIFNNTHLIYGNEMPACFVQFFTNTIVWDVYAATTTEGALPKHLEDESVTKYSREFDDHVVETAKSLKGRIEQLHKMYTYESSKNSGAEV